MSRSRTLLTTRGLDALVVVLAVAGSVGTLLRPAGQHPDGTLRQVLEAVVIGLMILGLLLRRRAPFLAPALTWMVSAALSFVDGRLIVGQTALSIAGMLAAVLLGNLSDTRQARVGFADCRGLCGNDRLQRSRPHRRKSVLHPGPLCARLVGRVRPPPAVRAGRGG